MNKNNNKKLYTHSAVKLLFICRQSLFFFVYDETILDLPSPTKIDYHAAATKREMLLGKLIKAQYIP